MAITEPVPTSLMELSQVNFGLLVNGRRSIMEYRPEWFHTPYDEGAEILSKPGAKKEDVAKVMDSSYMNDAHDAVHRWNGTAEEYNWPKMLKEAYQCYVVGCKLEKVGKKMKNNEPVDVLALYSEIGAIVSQENFGLTPADQIEYKAYKPFKPCGYDPIDKTLGGIPTDGPIIIYGLTGVGKSKFAAAIINGLLHKYPEETAAVYTLEMGDKHWLWRTLNLFPSMKDVLPRLHVSGSVRDIEELVAEVSAKKVNYVVLDDMDNMVKSSDASEYERIYRRVKEICRFLNIPVFVLGQPNRVAKHEATPHYNNKGERVGGRFLGRYDVAWSGAAENSAALQIALQTAEELDLNDESFPSSDDKMDYLIFWKSRDGWPGDYDPTKAIGPGAVVMSHSPNWQGNPYGGKWKLWPVNSGGKALGKKKKRGSDD